MTASVDLLKALYAPAAVVPTSSLVDLADSLQGQIVALTADPTPERCEAVAANLDGARRAVLRLREALLSKEGADVEPSP